MAVTQAQIDALEKALYQGALSVTYPDGGSVTYRSVADLRTALADAKNELAAAAGTQQSQSLGSFSKD